MSELGAASIIITLSEGGIKIVHEESGIVLHSYPKVTKGTWEFMFDTIINLVDARTIAE